MTTSRINAYRWPARLVSHKPFAAERYFITSSSIWQVFFAENYDFSFLFSLFCQWPHFLCKMHNPGAFCRWKTPRVPLQHQYGRERRGLYLYYKGTPSVKACRLCQLPRGGSLWHSGKVSGSSAMLAGVPAPPGGAVAQRLRGYGWRSEKSVKALAPTGAALAFLCFDFFFRIVKGEQPLARCGVGGVQR